MGPLKGLKVIEMAGLGPTPFGGMVLCDLGADVLRIDRAVPVPSIGPSARFDLLGRGRKSVALDLKRPEGVEAVLRLVEKADVLMEGFRPGVMERLGLSPNACWIRNASLVYARTTGWGQSGTLATTAGHDINYIGLAGALHAIGRHEQPPTPPHSFLGDFGAGGSMLVAGVLAALYEVRSSGKGQVIDVSIVDGTAQLMTSLWGRLAHGSWRDERGTNMLDSGAPFYDVYETSDGKYMSVGALEPGFYANLLRVLGLNVGELPSQHDQSRWPELKARIAAAFKTRTRHDWEEAFGGVDACVSPVLSVAEAPSHPHNIDRQAFVEVEGLTQPAPSPRFSRTPSGIRGAAPCAGQDTEESLLAWGFGQSEVHALLRSGAAMQVGNTNA